MGQVGFRADWNKTERDTITIQGDMYATKAGQQLQLSTYNPPANPAVEGNGYFSGQNLMATWRRLLKSGGDLQLRAFYDRTDRHDLNYGENSQYRGRRPHPAQTRGLAKRIDVGNRHPGEPQQLHAVDPHR